MQTTHYVLPTQTQFQRPYLGNQQYANLIDLSDEKTMARLVASLKYVFHLNQGLELPFILGCPHCDNNDDALICWITQVLKQTDWVEASHIFNFLIGQLKQQLEAYHQEWM